MYICICKYERIENGVVRVDRALEKTMVITHLQQLGKHRLGKLR